MEPLALLTLASMLGRYIPPVLTRRGNNAWGGTRWQWCGSIGPIRTQRPSVCVCVCVAGSERVSEAGGQRGRQPPSNTTACFIHERGFRQQQQQQQEQPSSQHTARCLHAAHPYLTDPLPSSLPDGQDSVSTPHGHSCKGIHGNNKFLNKRKLMIAIH